MGSLALFVPTEAAPLLFLIGAFALILSLRRFAVGCFVLAIVLIFVLPLIEPMVDMLPDWALVLLLIYVGIAMLRAVFELFIGRRAADHAMGALAADFVKFLVKALFMLPILGIAGFIALIRAVVR